MRFARIAVCKASCSALLCLLAACAAVPRQACEIDFSLVPSRMNYSKPDTSPLAPSAFEYRGCAKTLIYVAADHTNQSDSPTFRLIRSIFARYRIDAVIVEGVEAQAGINPGGDRGNGLFANAMRNEGTPMDSEGSLAMRLAKAQGAAIIGGEPGDNEIVERVSAFGISTEDLFAFYVLRYVQQWRREGAISSANDPALDDKITRFAVRFAKHVNIPLSVLSGVNTLAGFKAWYYRTNGARYEDAYRPGDSAPLFTDGESRRTNVIAMRVSDVRERSIVSTIAAMLGKYDTVMIVYGAGHYGIDAVAIDAAFGPPRPIASPRT